MIQIPTQGDCWVFLSLFITQPLVLIPFAHLSNPGLSIPMKCFLFEAESLRSTNGCSFSSALCHKTMPLSPFLETGSGAAEIGRSTALKASAKLRKHKAGFFRVLFSPQHFTWSQNRWPLTVSAVVRASPWCLAEGGHKVGTKATSSM